MRTTLLAVAVALATTTTAAADAKVPVYSVWEGTYVCGQGITNVRLTIETNPEGGTAFGHFAFSANAANKSVPSGSYWLKGAIHASASGKLEVKLEPQRWEVHPQGYVMVGLTATSDSRAARARGSHRLRELLDDLDPSGRGRARVTRYVSYSDARRFEMSSSRFFSSTWNVFASRV